ncbi:MAG TPA: translation factor GTPase family protein [Nocardioidaceae bacterium]
MPTLNLGIVAHVDAGKTTLTERLLYDAGVISRVGSVDHGDTVTDSDAIERRRGITIRSAVVTFDIGDRKVNLIDTPGHSDFVAEVERALSVLDGAVLVVSAVEGVQAQTRVLIRILERLQIPFLVFVNKVDRVGASQEETLGALREALAGDAVAMNLVTGIGTRSATVCTRPSLELRRDLELRLAEYDDDVLRHFVDATEPLAMPHALNLLTRTSAAGHLHPVYFGSAMTGAGVEELRAGIARHLPAYDADVDAPLHGRVFKIERRRSGRAAFVRILAGRLCVRDNVPVFHRTRDGGVVERSGRVTAIRVFARGQETDEVPAAAGDIAVVTGLDDVAIGDQLGRWNADVADRLFAPPTLEAVVEPAVPAGRAALFEALQRLTDQDPFIQTRLDGVDEEVTVSLYGEVQKEVLTARLSEEFGVEARFLPTQVIHVERVSGVGEARGRVPMGNVAVGLRVEPGPVGCGVDYRLGIERGWLLPSFHVAVEEGVFLGLQDGLFGWQVVDCRVTLVDGRFCAPTPSAGEFRRLTTSLLRKALERAGTTVCEPYSEFDLEFPSHVASTVLGALAAGRASDLQPQVGRERGQVTGVLPTASVPGLEQKLPDITEGRGVWFTRPAGHRPVVGEPVRRRHVLIPPTRGT